MMGSSPMYSSSGRVSRGRDMPGLLERKVAVTYSIMREASVFVAATAINNGIVSVQEYVPFLHGALINLAGFEVAVVTACSYGAFTWPNVELRDFAISVVELGSNMSFHTQAGSMERMPASTIHNTGVALKQFGLALAQMADNTYFCQHDLSHVVSANRPSFELSANIVNGLTVDALSHSLGISKEPAGLEHLRSLITDYARNHASHMEKLKASKRGKG